MSLKSTIQTNWFGMVCEVGCRLVACMGKVDFVLTQIIQVDIVLVCVFVERVGLIMHT